MQDLKRITTHFFAVPKSSTRWCRLHLVLWWDWHCYKEFTCFSGSGSSSL